MTRTLAISAFVAACMLSGCNKSEPETTPEPAAAAAAPAKDSTMAGEQTVTDSSKAMTDSTKMTTDTTMSMPMPADTTMSMPSDSTKQ